MAYTYHRTFLTHIDEKYTAVLGRLPPASSILEIGCHTGSFSKLLIARGHRVLGIDNDESALRIARNSGVDALCVDVEAQPLSLLLAETYDRILLMDILEHLQKPEDFLISLKPLLSKGGRLLITGPNIAYWAVRKDFLLGRWIYQDSGMLDRTHVHFYTASGWRLLIEKGGYTVTILVPSEGLLPLEHLFVRLPYLRNAIIWLRSIMLRFVPTLFASGFLIEANPR